MTCSLDDLESRTIYILREACNRIGHIAMLWSVGKDSNALLWLARKAFFGTVPFPVVQLDTGMELPEVYEFRDRLTQEWGLDLRIVPCPPEDQIDPSLPPATRAAARKTQGLKALLATEKYEGIIVGIRRDEQAMRAKERVFSPRQENGAWDFRNQPAEIRDLYNTKIPPGCHMRIHPLLHWTEVDIWKYTKRENLPIVPLYFARDGKRYRSLGEKNITFPIESNATTVEDIIAELEATKTPERAGRAMDHETESSFETLRTQGYM